jgi:hypothetical protein
VVAPSLGVSEVFQFEIQILQTLAEVL